MFTLAYLLGEAMKGFRLILTQKGDVAPFLESSNDIGQIPRPHCSRVVIFVQRTELVKHFIDEHLQVLYTSPLRGASASGSGIQLPLLFDRGQSKAVSATLDFASFLQVCPHSGRRLIHHSMSFLSVGEKSRSRNTKIQTNKRVHAPTSRRTV